MHRLFVYGTLKNGQPNNHYMTNPVSGKCHYIGTARTEEAFPLVIGTTWNIPLLLYAPGKGQKVYGEIHEVDDNCLQWLDEFECHPTMYERDKISVRRNDSTHGNEEDVVECWVYFLKKFEPSMVDYFETYSNYDALGNHNRIYSSKEDRSSPDAFADELKGEYQKIASK